MISGRENNCKSTWIYYDFSLSKEPPENMKLFPMRAVKPSEEPESLMLLVKLGDKNAFAALYERFKGPIFSYLRGFAPEEAEDLLHETFLRVYRARESYEPKARFSTWLWTIARHVALDKVRKKTELLEREEGELDEPTTLAEDGPEALFIEQIERRRVDGCMAGLPPRQKEMLLLRAHGEHSYEEIATLTGLSLANVKTQIHRAKQNLMACLKGGA